MSALGAVIGLLASIFLIVRKVSPVYSLILGAILGGLVGGMGLGGTISNMVQGVKDITPAIVRILAAGVLSGVLIVTGAADSISHAIVNKLGHKHVFLALALSAMLLTATGVFIDVAVITVAPVALTVGYRLGIPKLHLLMVMVGGGKCGNIISPNPNTIIAAENMGAPLPMVMAVSVIPAIIGLIFTVYLLSRLMPKEGERVTLQGTESERADLPPVGLALVAPLVAVALLALRPIFGIVIDPLIALPAGGLVGILAMRRTRQLAGSLKYGLEKMSVVAVLLVGTGTIAGIIKASTLNEVILGALSKLGIGDAMIAPVSGALMSAATASTTAGATVASASFGAAILASGVSAIWGAAMINSGATMLDHLPHGSFFHATGGSVEMDIRQRLKLIPYETAVGAVLAISTTVAWFIAG